MEMLFRNFGVVIKCASYWKLLFPGSQGPKWDNYYELKVYFPLKFICWSLSVMTLGVEFLEVIKVWWGHEGRAFLNVISDIVFKNPRLVTLFLKTLENSRVSSTMWGCSIEAEKMGFYEPGLCQTLNLPVLNFQIPSIWNHGKKMFVV